MRKSEDRSHHRHDNRAVARYNQIPGGRDQQKTDWTRRPQGTNQGGGQDEGGDAARKKTSQSEATPNNTRKTHRTTEGDTNNTPQRPRHSRNTTGQQRENAQTKPQPTHQDRQSRPINRAGRLTRAPTHYPETSGKRKRSTLKGQKANQTTAKKGGKSQTKKGGVKQASRRIALIKKGGEYLRHTECSVLKKV